MDEPRTIGAGHASGTKVATDGVQLPAIAGSKAAEEGAMRARTGHYPAQRRQPLRYRLLTARLLGQKPTPQR